MKNFFAWLRVCPLWYRDRETHLSFCWDNIDTWNMDVRNSLVYYSNPLQRPPQEVSILFTVDPLAPKKPGPKVTVSFPPVKNK